jgi:sugar lactone lactonase YvrE
MQRLSHGRDALSTEPPLSDAESRRTSFFMTKPNDKNRAFTAFTFTALAALTLAGAQAACTEDAAAPGTPLADAAAPAIDATKVDATPAVDGAVADADAGPPVTVAVTSFDATKFELAEGLALRNGDAYVSLAPLGSIVKVTPAGVVSPYGSVPPGYNDGYTLGLAFDAQGALFVAQTKNAPAAAVTPGIFKIPAGGSAAAVTTPFATDAAMTFPNGIAIGDQGDLLVTDSGSGIVFRVTAAGQVSRWKEAVELQGSPACPGNLPFPIGANGIVRTASEVFVTNTAKGSVVRIAVDANGSAGALTTVIADCKYLGLDGIARDADGSLVVAQNGSPGRVLRITSSGAVTVLHDGKPLDGPGSVVIADAWKGRRAALVTSTAFFSVGVDGGAPQPALLEIAPLP